MAMKVDRYFEINEAGWGKPIPESEYKFLQKVAARTNKKGKGHECPFCHIGFFGKSYGRIKCPNCLKEWIVK
jgi:hypothetical protein